MATDAELLLTMEVSRKALKKSMSEIEKAMKQVSEKSGENLEDALEGAGKKGSKKMAKRIKKGLSTVTASVAGALVAGFVVAQNRVSTAEGSMNEILGDPDARMNIAFARGQGMTNSEFTAFNDRVMRAGGDEQMTRDFAVDTSEFIAQARAGENDLLANFKGYKGAEQFNAVLSSLAGKDADLVNKFLADIGWAGDSGVIFNMLNELGGSTGNEAFKKLNEISDADRKRADAMEKEAKLEQEFLDMTRNANINAKSGLLENMNSGTISAYAAGLEQIAKEEIQAITNYESNKEKLLKAEKVKNNIENLVVEVLTWMVDKVIPWATKFLSPKSESELKKQKMHQHDVNSRKINARYRGSTDTQ